MQLVLDKSSGFMTDEKVLEESGIKVKFEMKVLSLGGETMLLVRAQKIDILQTELL
jgi:hypothetical protein